jgi:hypothetical protein
LIRRSIRAFQRVNNALTVPFIKAALVQRLERAVSFPASSGQRMVFGLQQEGITHATNAQPS